MMNFHEERHRSSHTRVFLPPVTVSTRTCINYYSLEVQQLAPENKPGPKRTGSSSKHHFSGENSLLNCGGVTNPKQMKSKHQDLYQPLSRRWFHSNMFYFHKPHIGEDDFHFDIDCSIGLVKNHQSDYYCPGRRRISHPKWELEHGYIRFFLPHSFGEFGEYEKKSMNWEKFHSDPFPLDFCKGLWRNDRYPVARKAP